MLEAVVRSLAQALVRLYYPDRVVENAERLPAAAPALMVANHPNGLLDPLVLRVASGRPVQFLAKSGLFGNPASRLAMSAFGCVPVYRAHDKQASDQDRAAANERTFAVCRERLSKGAALALFPEGVSHSDPQLKPLKTGAARIALSAEREHTERTGQPLGLLVVPVGLGFEAKAIFRSRVLVVVGQPIPVAERLAEYRRDERGAVDRLTDDVKAALDEVVLQAESRDLLEGVARVAAWTAPESGDSQDLAEQHRRARELLGAYKALNDKAPETVEPIVSAARAYQRVLRHLGVRDPWALELEPVHPGRALAAVLRLMVAAPVALLGAILGWIPYRLAGQVAKRVAKEEDVLGTVKLLAGAAFLFVFWLAESLIVGWKLGAGWGLLTFPVAIASGYVALRFEELTAEMVESLRHLWLRAAQPGQVRKLAARRRELADEISRALRAAAG
ncbi:MAG TPA: lysophospholipid acyltransferase family protein [Polyangia bacterium]|nr:lysophospholipid acyltransferase family protein [Polyangia bacterium]